MANDLMKESLIRRCEETEMAAWSALYRSAPGETVKREGVSIEEVGTTILTSVSSANVLGINRVLGFGLDEGQLSDELGRYIEHYGGKGIPRFFVQLSPFAGPNAEEQLETMGFRHYNNWVRLYRGVEDPPPAQTDFDVQKIDRSHASRFGSLVCLSFDFPTTLAGWQGSVVGQPGWHAYMAFAGKLGVATGLFFENSGVAWLSMATTDPDFRGRGGQSALLRRRILDAKALGCDLITLETAEQTPTRSAPSYRNVLRFGFREGYLRKNFIYEFSD